MTLLTNLALGKKITLLTTTPDLSLLLDAVNLPDYRG